MASENPNSTWIHSNVLKWIDFLLSEMNFSYTTVSQAERNYPTKVKNIPSKPRHTIYYFHNMHAGMKLMNDCKICLLTKNVKMYTDC